MARSGILLFVAIFIAQLTNGHSIRCFECSSLRDKQCTTEGTKTVEIKQCPEDAIYCVNTVSVSKEEGLITERACYTQDCLAIIDSHPARNYTTCDSCQGDLCNRAGVTATTLQVGLIKVFTGILLTLFW